MVNIFRAPADYQHFKDTIEDGEPVAEVKTFLYEDEKTKLERVAKGGIVRYWGSIPGEANTRNFKKLQSGDEILFYRTGHFIALCTIAFTTINPKLARHSWGETETGKTWELIYFFDSVQLFKIDSSYINAEFDFKDGPVMGFGAISKDKADKFLSKYDSVATLIRQLGIEEKIDKTIHDEILQVAIKSPYEAQFYLVDLGNQLKFATYVPATDAGRKINSKKLNEFITVRQHELEEYVAPVVLDPLSNIDVIWFKGNYQPKYFFEVIHKEGWSKALLRLDLVTKHYESAKAKIVGPKENETEFANALRKWSGPRDNIAFRDYDQLIGVHDETLHHQKVIEEFLG